MKNFEIIKNLVGEYITEDKLKNIDCYARPQLAIMIPTSESDISVQNSDIPHTLSNYILSSKQLNICTIRQK